MSKIVMTKKEFADLVSAKSAQEAIDCLAQTIDHIYRYACCRCKPEIHLLQSASNRLCYQRRRIHSSAASFTPKLD